MHSSPVHKRLSVDAARLEADVGPTANYSVSWDTPAHTYLVCIHVQVIKRDTIVPLCEPPSAGLLIFFAVCHSLPDAA